MKPLKDLLGQQASRLDLQRAEALTDIQTVLNGLYPGRTRAKKLQNDILTITTPSAAVAADLRLRQREILKKLSEYQISTIKLIIDA